MIIVSSIMALPLRYEELLIIGHLSELKDRRLVGSHIYTSSAVLGLGRWDGRTSQRMKQLAVSIYAASRGDCLSFKNVTIIML